MKNHIVYCPSAVLLHHTPLSVIAQAARTCTATTTNSIGDDLDARDIILISERLLHQHNPDSKEPKHDSVLDHLHYTFRLSHSRAVLQQIARHGIGVAKSIQSTRYTLKKFESLPWMTSRDRDTDAIISDHLDKLTTVGMSNDKLKYTLPEAVMTEGIYTFSGRALRNLFYLRTHRKAMREFRSLCWEIYAVLPEQHLFLYDDVLWETCGD